MAETRLSIALEHQGLTLPVTGSIAILRARPDRDYAPFPRDRLTVANTFRPAFDALATLGFDTVENIEKPVSLALVEITRSKAETLGLVAQAMAVVPPGGTIVVDGDKTDGIESVLKHCRQILAVSDVVSKSHGKLFWMARPAALPDGLADWQQAASPTPNAAGFITAPGMFSPDKIDAGSALLAAEFDTRMKGSVADLGAGWGWLAAQALSHDDVTRVDLFEAEKTALDAARQNLPDARARFFWQDVSTLKPATPYDQVIANPPFHQSRAADPSLGVAFIFKAADILSPKGQFWLVANRQLPYEAALDAAFGHVKPLGQTPHFKLYLATKPRAAAARSKRTARAAI